MDDIWKTGDIGKMKDKRKKLINEIIKIMPEWKPLVAMVCGSQCCGFRMKRL